MKKMGSIIGSIWSYRTVRVAVSLVFVISGINKLFDPDSFAVIIDAYGLIPNGWSLLVAYGLATLELVAGLALLLDLKGGLTVLCALLLLFMAILIYGIRMGLDVDCGCFGPEDPEAEAFHSLRSALYRDFIILGGMLYLYFWRYRTKTAGIYTQKTFKQEQEKRTS